MSRVRISPNRLRISYVKRFFQVGRVLGATQETRKYPASPLRGGTVCRISLFSYPYLMYRPLFTCCFLVMCVSSISSLIDFVLRFESESDFHVFVWIGLKGCPGVKVFILISFILISPQVIETTGGPHPYAGGAVNLNWELTLTKQLAIIMKGVRSPPWHLKCTRESKGSNHTQNPEAHKQSLWIEFAFQVRKPAEPRGRALGWRRTSPRSTSWPLFSSMLGFYANAKWGQRTHSWVSL